METVFECLPRQLRARIDDMPGVERCEEIRVRVGQPVELWVDGKGRSAGDRIDENEMKAFLSALTDHSLYAHEEEIREGYFTIKGGFRVGLTGRYSVVAGEVKAVSHVGSICIRVAREIIGAADGVMDELIESKRPVSALVVSPPGMGKTTMLRDIARQLSIGGFRVAVSDERGELAGCIDGVPTMDLGPRCDVADGLAKRHAIPRLLRSMSPDVIVTDELGQAGDADAVRDAARCGVCLIASVHGRNLDDATARPMLSGLVGEKLFRRIVLLGGRPGHVLKVLPIA